MSYHFKKLFPFYGGTAAFKILVVSEGYTASEESQFYADATNLWLKIKEYHPFSTLPDSPQSISMWACFTASANHGYATSAGAAVNRTAFESYYDATGQQLYLNTAKTDAFVSDAYITNSGTDIKVSDQLFKNNVVYSANGTVVVFLLPSAGITAAETEVLDINHYHCVATTQDGEYAQVVVRAVAKIVGLGDEFDLAGTQYQTPSDTDKSVIDARFSNLIVVENISTPPSPSTTDYKWRPFFNAAATAAMTTHARTVGATVADRTLPTNVLSYDKIELWEGGGGFRTKIFRSAYDCLLRRRIGDSTLPVKAKTVGLCQVCMRSLERIFDR